MDVVYDKLVSSGMERGDARLVVDLSNHAMAEAMKAFERVTDSAPERLQTQVMMVTVVMMLTHLRQAHTDISALMQTLRERGEL